MITIPITEPAQLYAGDTWQWRREDLSDYPAPTWVLQYRFRSLAGGFEITAVASGAYHAISVPAATTKGYAAGTYNWQAWVQDATPTLITVRTGILAILGDLRANSAALGLDTRSALRVMFHAVESVLKKTATYEQRTMTWGDRTLERFDPDKLLVLYSQLKMEVQREEAAANGLNNNRYYVRMGRG